MFNDFTYLEFRCLLRLLARNRENLRFCDTVERFPARCFIVRHDIDYCLDAAVRMAEIEFAESVKATYFFLVSSSDYNIFSREGERALREIRSLGHEIGLHYDVAAMAERLSDSRGTLASALLDEAASISRLTGGKIRSIAMHNPSIFGEDPFRGDKDFVNAYDRKFTEEMTYFSDSCGAWREKTYSSISSSLVEARIQFLFHPVFWAEKPGDRWQRLSDWMNGKHAAITSRRDEITKLWLAHEGVIEHDRRSLS